MNKAHNRNSVANWLYESIWSSLTSLQTFHKISEENGFSCASYGKSYKFRNKPTHRTNEKVPIPQAVKISQMLYCPNLTVVRFQSHTDVILITH